jgi:ribosome maturation factor RimP
MNKKETIEAQAEELLRPILERLGLELYDVEYVKEAGNYYLRAYIDKEGGVTIDDCEAVSREYSPKLDETNFIDDVYTLEVSSPGLGRPLRRERDYEKSVGKELEIHTYKAVDGDKIFFGVLTAYDKDTVTIREENGNERTFRKQDLSMIRLAFDF